MVDQAGNIVWNLMNLCLITEISEYKPLTLYIILLLPNRCLDNVAKYEILSHYITGYYRSGEEKSGAATCWKQEAGETEEWADDRLQETT